MAKVNQIEEKLKAPFKASLLEWRVGRKIGNGERGEMFPYVSARGIQERLDEVFGTAGWTAEYTPIEKGILCRLTCIDGDKRIVKEDGAGYTDIEELKGGISGALKRAASVLGIGRYLYDLPKVVVNLTNGKYFNGTITLPDWAVPEDEKIGSEEVKVVYDKGFEAKSSTPAKPMTDEVKEAMEVVVTTDGYNKGKKIGEVSFKSLGWLSDKAGTEIERNAAKIVRQYKE